MALAVAAAAALALTACGGSGGGRTGTAAGGAITIFNGATGTITENWNPFSPTPTASR